MNIITCYLFVYNPLEDNWRNNIYLWKYKIFWTIRYSSSSHCSTNRIRRNLRSAAEVLKTPSMICYLSSKALLNLSSVLEQQASVRLKTRAHIWWAFCKLLLNASLIYCRTFVFLNSIIYVIYFRVMNCIQMYTYTAYQSCTYLSKKFAVSFVMLYGRRKFFITSLRLDGNGDTNGQKVTAGNGIICIGA